MPLGTGKRRHPRQACNLALLLWVVAPLADAARGVVPAPGHQSLRVDAAGAGGARYQGALAARRASSAAGSAGVKPIRINRGGAVGAGPPADHHVGEFECGATYRVNSKSDKWEDCPSGPDTADIASGGAPAAGNRSCPFFAQDRRDDHFCTFACVPRSSCAELNPKKPIADKKLGICRSCMVKGCSVCASDGTDTCGRCQSGYRLGDDGMCHNKFRQAWNCLYVGLGIVGVFLVVWVVDIVCRPVTNAAGLQCGLASRERQKLRMGPEDGRQLWPLSTNLLRTQVAGPGLLLHFNFQFMVMVWALLVAAGWSILALAVDTDLFVLGTRRFGTPRQNCILVAWGYETQQRLMWTKILFVAVTYCASFLLCLLYSVRQLRQFQSMDHETNTMKDFVAMCVGLPRFNGSERAEEQLRASVASNSGVGVVGVSICWNFEECEEQVMKAITKDMDELEGRFGPTDEGGIPYEGWLRKKLFALEQKVFGAEEEAPDSGGEAAMKELLCRMRSSAFAFVVFRSEADRDEAVRTVARSGGFRIQERTVQLQTLDCEPDTVQWKNFTEAGTQAKVFRVAAGFGFILLALAFWALVFYSPYAWVVMTFNYDNGQQPGFMVGFAFSMVVVIGNAIMYEVCARISDSVGFHFKDNKEACYMVLYTIACLFNVLLDMVTTYFISYYVMVGLGFRTFDGRRLENIETFTQRFETYAMQRSLAENTYAYAFPSTYLIPFLIEPAITIGLPLVLMRLIVRSHPEIRGRAAEDSLMSVPMEMGRYADILLDVILAILIFYFPGGFTATLFVALAGSHLFIYCFDHWRVLRAIPSCTFASMDVDWWSQAMLAPCCGLMLSCLVFKANCQEGYHCIQGMALVGTCTAAFAAHTVVHLLLLIHVVPRCGKSPPDDDPSGKPSYKDVAQRTPCTWFSSNPVHCLRSRHVYRHSPPVGYYVPGKEHLLKPNESIGAFFQCDEVKA